MKSTYSILALEYMPVSVAGGVRKALGGFLRYVQYRDQHPEPATGGLDGFVRYVAHRDRTSPAGRVFGRDESSLLDRRSLVDYVQRSTKGLLPKWVRGQDGRLEDRQRAVYQLILSPEDWRGLDLRRLARVAMEQLRNDAGVGGIGPWFGAEHRNTAHHHVHIVLAARREVEPGKFKALLITRARLQRMKECIWREIERQRSLEFERAEKAQTLGRQEPVTIASTEPDLAPLLVEVAQTLRRPSRAAMPSFDLDAAPRQRHRRPLRHPKLRSLSHRHHHGIQVFGAALRRLRAIAVRYQYRMERELEDDLARREREGWSR